MNSSSALVDWLLDSLELNTSLFHVGRYCGDWHASTHGLAQASFHLIVQGHCWLHIDGEPTPQALNNGDAVFLLRDFEFRLSGEASAAAAQECPRRPMQPLDSSATNGVGLVCGFFHFQSGLSAMIVDTLPAWIILRAGDPSLTAARHLFELILRECERIPAPSSALLERLCHLLFLYVLRQQVIDNSDLGGLAALGRQPAFANLLEQLIARPAEPWSLESMAACTGLSRSAFFKRFTELCGQSPGQVLMLVRMRHACQLFKQDQTVAAVSLAVGYQSVAAFTRAFRKISGQQPGAYRKGQYQKSRAGHP
ncbi:AraC family transcriptional regulator [Pseudomonas sp. MWU15-20650]|uniref:AraC family transcriptional regulator n=1 Tax=Pseudomonas sp. MWU15-20650 TaxID=2933107 RepID=UPI00200BB0F1|nr:AraC family transcriptional regulator [Pseudomonas sp. MWU15-20650]